MTNIIREDVVKLDFEIEGLKELQKVQKEVNDLKKNLTGGIGEDSFDDLKKGAEETVKPLKKVKEQADKVTKSLKDIGKKAATTAFNGVKKLAKISFKALAVGITGAATAIGGLVAKSVSAYAEFEQLKGGMETLLGAKGAKSVEEYAKITGKSVSKVKDEYEKLVNSEKLVMKNANDAFKTAGMSANEYMTTITSFSAALTTSLGGDTAEAAKLADVAIKDMADNANKMGTPLESVSTVYSNLARGMYMTLDNLKLGYAGTKEGAMDMVNHAAKIDKSVKANDISYANLVKAIHAVQVEMDIYGTTSKEAFGTITGSLNTFKGAWGNLMPALIQGGDAFDQCVNNLVDSLVGFKDEATGEIKGGLINNLMPAIEKALAGVGTLIDRLAPIISEQFPTIAQKLLPPLIKAAVELTKGLIKALPTIVTTLATTIVDIFGEQFPIIEKIGNFFKDNAGKIADSIKIIIPTIIALSAAFKGFKAIKGITSFFGALKGGKGESGEKGGIFGSLTNTFKELAKAKTTTILKGMANLAIILGGFVAMTAVLMLVAPLISKLGGYGELLKLVGVIGVLGIVGGVLAKFGDIAGKIPVTTTLKGLANMAIMFAGMSALLLLVSAVSLIDFDLKKILGIVGVISVLGLVGTALSLFAGIVGLIPVAVVALGLANMAIVIAGMSALFLLIGATSLLDFDLKKITQIVGIIGLLGTVGGVLSVFAGIVGLIPIPVVLLGLANMGLVLGGLSLLIVAFGELTRIKGFTEFLEKGGQVLVQIMNILGEMVGALAGGLIEGLSSCLPALGENLGKFGENIKPLFAAMSGVDMGGVGAFFTSLVGLLGVATGNEIVEGIKKFFGGEGESPIVKLGTQLSDFATNAKGFFTTIDTFPENSFTKAADLFESLAKVKNLPKADENGTTKLAAIATDLSTFTDKTSGFFAGIENINTEKVNALWESLKNADSIATDSLAKTNEEVTKLIKLAAELPAKMGDGIKEASSSLSTAIVEMWKDAVEASVKPVNKLLSGANHILKEFGSKKRVIEWQPYAKGTDGHRGGNALVNDGRGAELIQMPNGRMFIPNGRNVFLPNAPRGMKVLPAEQTARLMGKSSPSFRYADGTGEIDVWSYFDNAKGLVNKIAEGISYDGMSGLASGIGKGIVSTFKGEMVGWIDKLFEQEGGKSLASYVASKGVGQWRSTVIRALKMEGQYSAANVARTLFQMQTESGGNPRAINLWDSNAKKGIPSKGLMQVIDPTFRAYARKGFDKNIYDPLSNILASVRYATSRYGSLSKAYQGHGYSKGVGTVEMPERSINLSYTPESDSGYYARNSVEQNTYAPHFEVNISGTNDDRTMYRKIKRMIAEAWNEMLDDLEAKTPQTQQV